MKYDKTLIKEKIKELRLKRKELYIKNPNKYEKYICCKTQEDFSDAIGVDRRTVINWEKGNATPSLHDLIKICNILDCNIEYFLVAGEFPYIDTISKASHFTGIKPEIIKKAQDSQDFLDCLNFFMLPENCKELFNKITLSAWKEYWINQNLEGINPPLINIIETAFENFYSFTPFQELCKDTYKDYLIEYLPSDNVCFEHSSPANSHIYPKKALSTSKYAEYKIYAKNNSAINKYDCFIEYIVQTTYEPLINREFIEIQKQKVAKKFVETLSRYLKCI